MYIGTSASDLFLETRMGRSAVSPLTKAPVYYYAEKKKSKRKEREKERVREIEREINLAISTQNIAYVCMYPDI